MDECCAWFLPSCKEGKQAKSLKGKHVSTGNRTSDPSLSNLALYIAWLPPKISKVFQCTSMFIHNFCQSSCSLYNKNRISLSLHRMDMLCRIEIPIINIIIFAPKDTIYVRSIYIVLL